MDYKSFLSNKLKPAYFDGIPLETDNPLAKAHQKPQIDWALKRGRACLFNDCGLGKGFMLLDWSRLAMQHTKAPALVLAPLGAAKQLANTESLKFGIPATYIKSTDEMVDGVNVSNYERLENIDVSAFGSIVLDESSILKAFGGKMRDQIIETFKDTPFKLACSATPSPNDYTELGNHSEFLGIMSRAEMLATYFINDMGESATWRLKGHATKAFWQWVCSWALLVRRPSDIGLSDDGFTLPPLVTNTHIVKSDYKPVGRLFSDDIMSLSERRAARNSSIAERAQQCADIANATAEQFLIWCDGNDEADAVTSIIAGAVQVAGSDSAAHKEQCAIDFASGKIRVLVSKPKIYGFGLNFQSCHRVLFCGISDSYEQFYQATRRCWRYGQKESVTVDIVASEPELPVINNILRKEKLANNMADSILPYIKDEMNNQLRGNRVNKTEYKENTVTGERWTLHLGDCVETIKKMADESIDYSVFSPPFASLYTYSSSDRDMGNCANHSEFYKHFEFLVAELYRVLRHGRLISFHCMNLPTSKQKDGVIGIRDFRGELIRIFEAAGFIYHSEVCIWKDPVLAMQRTKALGLLHKQLKKDSCMSRQGIPDYLVTVRKPGTNTNPVCHTADDFPVSEWQKIASPVWMDINPSDTLQYQSAREDQDEKHICPLQLEVIRRALKLWSNPNDLVLTPFAGIGSELYVSLQEGRRAVGCELKESYFKQAVLNCESAANNKQQTLLLS